MGVILPVIAAHLAQFEFCGSREKYVCPPIQHRRILHSGAVYLHRLRSVVVLVFPAIVCSLLGYSQSRVSPNTSLSSLSSSTIFYIKMAEEQPIIVETAAAPAENGSAENGGKKKKQYEREELVPIEDLFDLSKPIPKVGCDL